MKNALSCIGVIFYNLFLFSQPYYPLPEKNCIWSVAHFKIFINGDSIVNNVKYQKYYQTTDTTLLTEHVYQGLVRNDSLQKKVYLISPKTSTEKLLYNFNINLNDTLAPFTLSYNQYDKATVTQIDSIPVLGQYRRRFTISRTYSTNWWPVIWVENIGSLNGPLQPGFEAWYTFDVAPPELLCQQINGAYTYINSYWKKCYVNLVGINQKAKREIRVNIFPNPLRESLTIQITSFTATMELDIVILNSLGQNEVSEKLSSAEKEIDLSSLARGMYMVHIYKEGQLILSKKVVKQ